MLYEYVDAENQMVELGARLAKCYSAWLPFQRFHYKQHKRGLPELLIDAIKIMFPNSKFLNISELIRISLIYFSSNRVESAELNRV